MTRFATLAVAILALTPTQIGFAQTPQPSAASTPATPAPPGAVEKTETPNGEKTETPNGGAAPMKPDMNQNPEPSTQPKPDSITLDTESDMVGIAQQTASAKGLQGRIMWIDAGANIGNLNTPEKIDDIVAKIKKAGFNMIVLDVKPIVGDVIYPSKYAPKLTEWKGQKCPADLDVLRHVLDAAHAAGLTVYANMSTFGEGHKMVKRGLGYQKPGWQTTMYLSRRSVTSDGSNYALGKLNAVPKNDAAIGVVSKQSLIPAEAGVTVAVLNLDARVTAVYHPESTGAPSTSGAGLSPRRQEEVEAAEGETPEEALPPRPEIPPGGYALIGRGKAGEWIASHARVGEIILFRADPTYVRIADDNTGDQAYTIFVDPSNPQVRQHELDIVREIVTSYDVDGVVFDDRLRYAGINADFGEPSRRAFERSVGHPLIWPDDIYRDAAFPGQKPEYGPYFEPWLVWRANNITSWLKEAASTIRSIRPSTQVSVYVGSWYGDYYMNGSNWASTDFQGPWSWDNDAYRATAYAGELNWLTTGCYYVYPTIDDAKSAGDSPGESVEAAAQLSNRVVYDSAWIYAGIYALSYEHHVDTFKNAIKAAVGSSQGVMIFDMSQIVDYDWWDDIADAFGPGPVPAAPNTVPGLLDTVRAQHAADIAAGKPQPKIPSYQGLEDVGL